MFPKEYIEGALKDASGGVHILLEGATKDEFLYVALGYRYSQKTVLHFVFAKDGGSFKPGSPYKMKYTTFGNIYTQHVDHPKVVCNFLRR